jgi:mono/diheme cytochrome c family protein
MKLRRVFIVSSMVLLPFVLALVAVLGVLFARQGGFEPYRVPHGGSRVVASDAATLARGEYLARIGDCQACHTTRGGVPFAGGRAFATGFGTLYSPNITPDAQHGIGDWSADEFAHVMRHGVARRGVLYPVFPYAHFSRVSDADLDAIYAWLRTQPASANEPPPNRLEAPADSRRMLVFWRMWYERPNANAPIAPADRGRYLVDGLGHCAMCHSTRGDRGSLPPEGHLAGGVIPGLGWYAPPLDRAARTLFGSGTRRLLAIRQRRAWQRIRADGRSGLREPARVDGGRRARDRSSPQASRTIAAAPPPVAAHGDAVGGKGADLYADACADCHGKDGEGKPGAYPPLRDAVAMTAPDPINAVRMVLYGGMAITSTGNPRPHSMPPFAQKLEPADIAEVLNYARRRFGGRDSRLTAEEVRSMYGLVVD